MERNGDRSEGAPRPAAGEDAARRARLGRIAGEEDGAAGQEAAEPFTRAELARLARRPYLAPEYLLGGQRRLAASLGRGRDVWRLAALLLAVSVVATIPYSLLSPTRNVWKVSALITGSMLICLPCLHLFAQYLGLETRLEQTIGLSLVFTGAAALFTLGFAPVIWFIDLSTETGDAAQVTPAHVSVWLLAAAWVLGILQMARCIGHSRRDAGGAGTLAPLVVLWLPLLAFITYRMGRLLEVL